MSDYVGRKKPSLTRRFLPDSSNGMLVNPVLARIVDDINADWYTVNKAVGTSVARSVDAVKDFVGVGIVFRSATGKMRRVRLPARPGDLTLFVLFGPPPSQTVGAPSLGATSTLRHEAVVGALGCTAAVIGWIGLVVGAFVSGPVGWIAISLVAFDVIASQAANISCIESGVRMLNETRGHHNMNVAMDENAGYRWTNRAQDVIGLAAVPRALATASRAVLGVGGAAAATSTAGALAQGAKVVRQILITRDVQVELLNAVGAGIGLVGSEKGGVVSEISEQLPPFPTFTVALSN